MEHILPYPPNADDTTRIWVAHVYSETYLPFDDITNIDYAEDVRLSNSPWSGAEITSYPLIYQDLKLFRASEGITAVGEQGMGE